ncbi:MAG: BatA domain-containing protein [Planctomycetes bacterium]|nr:BatA domain-containing protein [Planctomycetota bacterium]
MNFTSALPFWILSALLVPIIIHLLSRKRPRNVDFGPMRILRIAVESQPKRFRASNFIFVILRTILIALLLLAMSYPVFEEEGLENNRSLRDPIHVVVLLDRSGSTHSRSADSSVFDQIQGRAVSVINSLKTGDVVSIFATPAEEGAFELLYHGADLSAAKDVIFETKSWCAPDGQLSLADVEKEALSKAGDISVHRAYFLTDVARYMPDVNEKDTPGESRDSAEEEEKDRSEVQWNLILFGEQEAVDFQIVDVVFDDPIQKTSQPSGFEAIAIVRGFEGSADSASLPELRYRVEREGSNVGGSNLGDWRSLIPSSWKTDEDFTSVSYKGSVTFENEGLHEFEAELEVSDANAKNNSFFKVVCSYDHLQVISVDGEPSGEPERGRFRGELSYFSTALSAINSAERMIPVSLDVISFENFFISGSLEADALILANITRLTETQSARIQEYLLAGNQVWISLGDRLDQAGWNDSEHQSGAGWFPCAMTSRKSVIDQIPAAMTKLGESSFERIRTENFSATVAKLKLTEWWETKPGEGAEVLMSVTSEGTEYPLLVSKPYGRGRVFVFLSSFDTEWNNMAVWPLFPSMIAEMILKMSSARVHRASDSIETPIDFYVPRGEWSSDFRIRVPGDDKLYGVNLEQVRMEGNPEPVGYEVRKSVLQECGISEIRWTSPATGSQKSGLFARNFPLSESVNFRKVIDPDEIEKTVLKDFEKHLNVSVFTEKTFESRVADDFDYAYLSRWLFGIIIVLLLVELLITPFFSDR